jgi:hypothetical protein
MPLWQLPQELAAWVMLLATTLDAHQLSSSPKSWY